MVKIALILEKVKEKLGEYNNITKTAKFFGCSRQTIQKFILKHGLVYDKTLARKMSPEGKLNLSNKRKEFLKNNPHKHPWTYHNKFKSVPCEKVKEWLISKNIEFIEEFNPQVPEHNYSIDIAFPDKKIGLEINGNQHYNSDGSLKEYYEKRENEIQKIGWTLYQIHYSLAFKINKLEKIIPVILNSPQKVCFNYSFYIKPNKKENIIKRKYIYEENIYPSNIDLINLLKTFSIREIADKIGITKENLYNKCYREKIKLPERTKKTKLKKMSMCICGNQKVFAAKKCMSCAKLNSRKVERPSKDELEKLIQEYPMTTLGKRFNVSDNCVKKWCKNYGLTLSNRLGYWSKIKIEEKMAGIEGIKPSV